MEMQIRDTIWTILETQYPFGRCAAYVPLYGHQIFGLVAPATSSSLIQHMVYLQSPKTAMRSCITLLLLRLSMQLRKVVPCVLSS